MLAGISWNVAAGAILKSSINQHDHSEVWFLIWLRGNWTMTSAQSVRQTTLLARSPKWSHKHLSIKAALGFHRSCESTMQGLKLCVEKINSTEFMYIQQNTTHTFMIDCVTINLSNITIPVCVNKPFPLAWIEESGFGPTSLCYVRVIIPAKWIQHTASGQTQTFKTQTTKTFVKRKQVSCLPKGNS